MWQSSYITDGPNKPEGKHSLYAASYNYGNMISRNKQLVDMICSVKRIPRQSVIAFNDHLNDLALLSHNKAAVLWTINKT